VNDQLTMVPMEVALSLQISEMYSQTIGPGPNSNTQTYEHDAQEDDDEGLVDDHQGLPSSDAEEEDTTC